MSITKEMVNTAEEIMTDLQARIYFDKLASMGIVPDSEDQAATLWELGDSILQQRPRLSDVGRETKQASLNEFGNLCSPPGHDGCSLDAHKITEELCRNPDVVKAAHILLAVGNVG